MKFQPETLSAAVKHLRSADPVLRPVIDRIGPFAMTLDRHRFRSLVRSIISQQISGNAARSIRARLEALTAPGPINAEKLLRLSPKQFRSAGVSPQKTRYLQDLAEKVAAGQVRLNALARMDDEEVIAELIQVKGIGVWTAQMFLMFSLGRLDVFPHDDLGIRSAIRNLYVLDELPDRRVSEAIAARWRPFATVASWYCWRSLE